MSLVYGLTSLVLAAGMVSSQSTIYNTTCTIPTWTARDINITYSDDSFTPGTASFNFTNSVSNKTESLTCPLGFNTRCVISGTPEDKDLNILLLVNLGGGSLSVNETWGCSTSTNATSPPMFVVGMAEFSLKCPDEITDTMTCWGSTTVITGELAAPNTSSE